MNSPGSDLLSAECPSFSSSSSITHPPPLPPPLRSLPPHPPVFPTDPISPSPTPDCTVITAQAHLAASAVTLVPQSHPHSHPCVPVFTILWLFQAPYSPTSPISILNVCPKHCPPPASSWSLTQPSPLTFLNLESLPQSSTQPSPDPACGIWVTCLCPRPHRSRDPHLYSQSYQLSPEAWQNPL